MMKKDEKDMKGMFKPRITNKLIDIDYEDKNVKIAKYYNKKDHHGYPMHNGLTYIYVFDEYENIHVYPEPEVIDFGGVSVLFMPWMNSENYSECVKYLQQAKADIYFGHLELSG